MEPERLPSYTFYFYKGGVGRSMALANIAECLYLQGLRVLMIDWDLETPGLESFFFQPDPDEKSEPDEDAEPAFRSDAVQTTQDLEAMTRESAEICAEGISESHARRPMLSSLIAALV